MSEIAGLDLPERRLFWRWVWEAVRPVLGWVLALVGAIMLVVGWYGVSGQALTAKQLPYLVSAGLGGIAVVIIAGVFLATDDIRRQLARLDALEAKVDDLHRVFVQYAPAAAEGTVAAPTVGRLEPATETLLALPNGKTVHRPGCALIAGRPAVPVTTDDVTRRGLRPCRVCDPDLAAA